MDKESYEYLQIDFGNLTVITKVEVQGRFGNGQVRDNVLSKQFVNEKKANYNTKLCHPYTGNTCQTYKAYKVTMLILKDFLQLDMLSTNRITLQHGPFSD